MDEEGVEEGRAGRASGPTRPAPGEVWVAATCDGDRQVVCVLRAAGSRLVVALTHPYTEYACHSDVVVSRRVSGCRFDLVVCAGVVAVVDATACCRLLGRLPEGAFADVTSGRRVDADAAGWWNGTRMLAGPFEARLELRSELIARAHALTSGVPGDVAVTGGATAGVANEEARRG